MTYAIESGPLKKKWFLGGANLAVGFATPQVEPFGLIDFKQKRRNPAPTNPNQQSTVVGNTKNKVDRLAPPPYSPDT